MSLAATCRRGRRLVCGVGAERRQGIGDRRLERLGAREDALAPRWDGSGIWEGSIPEVQHGQAYKYRITSRWNDFTTEKADPVGFFSEAPPATGSRAWSLEWEWRDGDWMASRGQRNGLAAPISIYEAAPGIVAAQGR
jgi:1,4-alpha-glucan branching enzyme